jgi:hypothetical protein
MYCGHLILKIAAIDFAKAPADSSVVCILKFAGPVDITSTAISISRIESRNLECSELFGQAIVDPETLYFSTSMIFSGLDPKRMQVCQISNVFA